MELLAIYAGINVIQDLAACRQNHTRHRTVCPKPGLVLIERFVLLTILVVCGVFVYGMCMQYCRVDTGPLVRGL
jgi:hypothetical protein